MFIWNFSSHLTIFHSFGDVTIAGEGLQILTYARRSWPLSSHKRSSACQSYCDTGHPLILIISEDLWHSQVCRGWASNNQPSACRANPLTHCATNAASWLWVRLNPGYINMYTYLPSSETGLPHGSPSGNVGYIDTRIFLSMCYFYERWVSEEGRLNIWNKILFKYYNFKSLESTLANFYGYHPL